MLYRLAVVTAAVVALLGINATPVRAATPTLPPNNRAPHPHGRPTR